MRLRVKGPLVSSAASEDVVVRFIYEQRPGESKSVDQVVTQGESVRGGRNDKGTDPGVKHETQRQKQCEKLSLSRSIELEGERLIRNLPSSCIVLKALCQGESSGRLERSRKRLLIEGWRRGLVV